MFEAFLVFSHEFRPFPCFWYLIELGYAAHRYAEIGVGPSSFKLFGFVYLNLFFKLVAAYSRVSNNRAELL